RVDRQERECVGDPLPRRAQALHGAAHPCPPPACAWQPAAAATSRPGLRWKKPLGLSQNETVSTGMTGHSSGRVTWLMPNTYQSTTSASSIGRFCFVHTGRPVSVWLWVGISPHGQRSSSAYAVTHSVWPITCARSNTGEERSISAGS